MKQTLLIVLALPAILAAQQGYQKRLAQSTVVLKEMSRTSDKGVPQDLLVKAQCVVVVPGLKKVAFIGGGKFGRGFASCITSKGWSAPAAIRIEGGSFGFQLGASSTDVVLLVMNQGGMTKLMSSKFTLGGEAAAAAGPVGRTLSGNTDALMKAEILSYSRSRGVFAGLSLEGATLREDGDENAALYGKPVTDQELLTGAVTRPAAANAFMRELQRFSGKGTPPVISKRHKGKKDAPIAADNTKMNQGDANAAALTADQSKNNRTDLDIVKTVRRSVVEDKSLSTYAHNVKIIVTNGAVTLKGPVRTEDEKALVAAKAVAVVGADHVTNEIEVKPE